MADVVIRRAGREDVAALHHALAELSADIGDDHGAGEADLLRHGFGPEPAFQALLAQPLDTGEVLGVAVYSPVFSTVRAGAGFYVSDLWVSQAARGMGLGKRLLGQVVAQAPQDWTVRFLKLAVYDDNPSARAFYERLGFVTDPRETYLSIVGEALDALKETS
ncbi:GNAT family N-acetyltransferase [Stappia sp. GBMRC 2046]|uniref:GNAT family N-acetyltransferase n=1 Tax=Stappia sediminis TaxID=2692190 RepID=A0A7X3LRS5_9HYPH|nr:N-acetyltransferase [Stappia sediminis]MXN63904.1 GNAT family N-acetyltransferase [Stappia sediminis]